MPVHSQPPSIALTSPVSVAASRILSAYLSHHRLSVAETASLSAAITTVMTALMRGGAAMSGHPAVPSVGVAPGGRASKAAKPRSPRRSRLAVTEEQAEFDLGDADAVAMQPPSPVDTAPDLDLLPEAAPDAEPPPSEVGVEFDDALEAEPLLEEFDAKPSDALEAASASEGKKRKRPSRPRSKRRAAREGLGEITGPQAQD